MTAKPALVRVTGTLARRYPQLGPYLRALAALNGPLVKVLAVDATPASLRHGFLTTAYLKLELISSRARWLATVLAQVEADPGVTGRVSHRYVRLPAGQALEARYNWNLSVPGGVYKVVATQYAVLTPDAAFMLVYWTSPAQDAAYRPLFERSAQTLQFTG